MPSSEPQFRKKQAQRPVTHTTDEVRGRVEGAMSRGSPGRLVVPKRQGQRELSQSDELPTEMHPSRAAFEKLGFKFGAPVKGQELLTEAELPKGWRREGLSFQRWSYLLDENGKKRVAIFYKAAAYDLRASMYLDACLPVEG